MNVAHLPLNVIQNGLCLYALFACSPCLPFFSSVYSHKYSISLASSLVFVLSIPTLILSLKMGKSERLKLLFEDEVSLLHIDTHLKAPTVPTVSVSEVPKTNVRKGTTAVKQDDVAEEHAKPTEEKTEVKQPSAEEANAEAQATSVDTSGSFCPAVAVSRLPYKFIQAELSQKVASEFFDEGKFWNRPWDL